MACQMASGAEWVPRRKTAHTERSQQVPTGIAADAFHEKSTGLTRLFELLTPDIRGMFRSESRMSGTLVTYLLKSSEAVISSPNLMPESAENVTQCGCDRMVIIDDRQACFQIRHRPVQPEHCCRYSQFRTHLKLLLCKIAQP